MVSHANPINSADTAHELLKALAEQLTATDAHFDLVVIGGSALLVRGLVKRATQDVDVAGPNGLRSAETLPPELIAAARWTRQHDPSEGFLSVLLEALKYFGVEDADLRP